MIDFSFIENAPVDQDTNYTSLTDFQKSSPRVPRGSNAGFSLLELLLVLFIMGLMTATTMLMTGGVEDQSKYDETKRRMELIKRAIVGDSTRTVNGGPEISGFVADMGRLPGCLEELLEKKECDPSVTALPDWQMDTVTGLWRGWRGPYIDTMPDSDGIKHFRDGYGYNWGVFSIDSATSAVQIRSLGADGAVGGSGSAADIPVSGVMALVEQADYLTQDTLTIIFTNQSATSAVQVDPTQWHVDIDSGTAVIASTSFKVDNATSAVSVAPGGNINAEATFPSKLVMGMYQLETVCTSCANVTSNSTPYQIVLPPRNQLPPFRWNIAPQ